MAALCNVTRRSSLNTGELFTESHKRAHVWNVCTYVAAYACARTIPFRQPNKTRLLWLGSRYKRKGARACMQLATQQARRADFASLCVQRRRYATTEWAPQGDVTGCCCSWLQRYWLLHLQLTVSPCESKHAPFTHRM